MSKVEKTENKSQVEEKSSKLKIYSGNEHPHAAQNPKTIELKDLNNKNIVRN